MRHHVNYWHSLGVETLTEHTSLFGSQLMMSPACLKYLFVVHRSHWSVQSTPGFGGIAPAQVPRRN